MTSPKKEVAPAKLGRGDHEEESQLTRPESYEVLHGVDSPSSPPASDAHDKQARQPTFTRLTSDGDLLTKSISLVKGKIKKVACAQPRTATAQTCEVSGLVEFAAVLDALQETQAHVYGVMLGRKEAQVVTEVRRAQQPNAISRTRQFFQFAAQPGIMMFDHDGMEDGRPIAPTELHNRLVRAVPPLANVRMLWRPSASSGIVGPDGAMLTELVGQRFYLLVEDASLIPQAGEAIWELLWAAHEGWIAIGKAGQRMERGLVDKMVWQPERLDFAAAPRVAAPLSRTPTQWQLLGQGPERLDLRSVIGLADKSVRRKAGQNRHAALQAAEGESDKVRREWVRREAPKLAKKRGVSEESAREILARASSTQTLLGNFELLAEGGTRVTVAEILANRDRWHGRRFADPLEPDYHDDRRVAWANLNGGGPPYIYSHAHGGCRYRLARELRVIEVREGERTRVVDECMEVMRAAGEVFELGHSHALVHIERGQLVPVSPTWLLDHLQRHARFEVHWVTKDGIPGSKPTDLKDEIAKAILAKGSERMLPSLTAVVTAPTLRDDGSLLDESGYDAASGLLLLRDEPDATVPIPNSPTHEQAVQALAELWRPFRLFPFVGPAERGTLLAALLTACVRTSLPTAPGFGFDAPEAGTGKTLLARCVGALATGQPPAILAPVANREEGETRKRLFALLREGARVITWDNITEPLGNDALNAFLTASTFNDRVLGISGTATLPNRALVLFTGNNLRFLGDICRRIPKVRLDAKQERPYARAFPFCPLHWTLANRQQMVACALTILRARIVAGRPRPASGGVASFEEWDELVRQTVVWIAEIARKFPAIEAPLLDDPMKTVDKSLDVDVEAAQLKALLFAWNERHGDKRVVVGDVIAPEEPHPLDTKLHAIMYEIAGEHGRINAKSFGSWLARNVDRPVDGVCLRRGKPRGGRATWRLLAIDASDSDDDDDAR